jgi:hypothetical protein
MAQKEAYLQEELVQELVQEESGYTEKQTNPSDTADCSKRIISEAKKALGSS